MLEFMQNNATYGVAFVWFLTDVALDFIYTQKVAATIITKGYSHGATD